MRWPRSQPRRPRHAIRAWRCASSEGLSHEECAEILGCRVGTSKSQLHKARAKMRELLGPDLARERQERRQ